MCAATAYSAEKTEAEKLQVWIGTYTGQGSEGIYRSQLDLSSGKLSEPQLAAKTANPSFLALHPARPLLYSVSEISEMGGKKTGGVTAFAIDESGGLKQLNQEMSQGMGPCHLNVDRSGKVVLVANYGSGTVASLPILEDGRLGPAKSVIQHQGNSVNPQRQEGPHAHSINMDPTNRFAVAADLGIDKLMIYRLDADAATLSPHEPPFFALPPGAGPRHLAFHPSGRYAYVINELASSMSALAYDSEKGQFADLQTETNLPHDFTGSSTTAEVQVHPSGKFLYGSNRGHDSIAMFAIDEAGKLTALGHEPSGGKTPRNFGIEPSGRFLVAAHQDSDNIVVFRIGQDGKLQRTADEIRVSRPVCIKFRQVD